MKKIGRGEKRKENEKVVGRCNQDGQGKEERMRERGR